MLRNLKAGSDPCRSRLAGEGVLKGDA